MVRLIAATLSGLFVGAAAVWLYLPSDSETPEAVVRDIVAVPKMSGAAAATHRAAGYMQLSSVEEIEALPTAFARAEALFALAGRSGPAELQALIFDANRLADDNARRDSLNTLFFRLAEAEPESALALARTAYFQSERNLEFIVWHTWASDSLDDAIFAAKGQTSSLHRTFAAQGLFAAHGDLGNATTDHIEAELGIGPNRETRARHLYRLADRSPEEAIAFINGLPDGYAKSEYVSWLAHYLARRDPAGADAYANLVTDQRYRDLYRGNVRTRAALENPTAEIDRILASGNLQQDVGSLHSAMRVLVSQDFDAALAYFNTMEAGDTRRMTGSVIAYEYAQKDPLAALAWARANDLGDHSDIERDALSRIAAADPQRALAEALLEKNPNKRHQQVAAVINSIGHRDPLEAVALLESLDDSQLQATVRNNLSLQWLEQDADTALKWMLSHDDQTTSQLLQNAAWSLVRSDLDAAIRLLPKVDAGNRGYWRQMIVKTMTTQRSVAEAMRFARQYESESDFPELQAAIIQTVAETNVAEALSLAGQLTDARSRDQAHFSIIGQHAHIEPQSAMSMVNSIADDALRATAFAQVASHWYRSDPAAVNRWISSLPVGYGRDEAIMHVASNWHTVSREQNALIDSISDAATRSGVKLQHAFAVAQYNPIQARRILDDPDISDVQRQQALRQFKRMGITY